MFEARDVGGGFGQRTPAYPEYCALMIAAKAPGKPVKWVSTRAEGFLTDTHGRGNIIDGELALDRDGKFLAMRLDWINDMGAYLSPGALGHIRNTTNCMTGVYRIPALYATYRVPLTNTTPVGRIAARGGRTSRMWSSAWSTRRRRRSASIPAELRRRNFIPPEAFPYTTPTGSVYENADLPGLLAEGAQARRLEGLRRSGARNRQAAGKLRGIGISTVIENTGAGNAPKDEVEIELDASGTVTVYTVSKSQGHGHETTLAMIVADALGIPLEQVKVVQCAPGTKLAGQPHRRLAQHGRRRQRVPSRGAEADRAGQGAGRARAASSSRRRSTMRNGEFRSERIADRAVKLADLAKTKTLSVMAEGKFGSTYPNGCHIAEVEVDPETGAPKIVSYCAVDDCGVVINHAIVEGQLHGGVVQGAGQVFGEQVVYDRETGQPLTASFMDYYMPRAGLDARDARRRASHAEQGEPARRQGRGRIRLHGLDAGARQRGTRRAAPARASSTSTCRSRRRGCGTRCREQSKINNQ